MKNIFRFLMAVAVLLTASCAKEDISSSIVDGREVEVTFSAALPELGTRAYADGAKATTLRYYVYDGDNYLSGISSESLPEKKVTLTNGKAVVTLPLLKGMTYNIIFWADNGSDIYSIDPATKVLTVDYTGVMSNDDSRDAFYKYLTNVDPTNATKIKEQAKVTLSRPFGQLNAATSDFEAVENNGVTLTTSALTAIKANNTLDLTTGLASNQVNITFAEAAIPTEALPNKTGYKYLSMNYLLPGTVDAEYTFKGERSDNSEVKFTGTTYTNVPIKANYRTNILGKLLTATTEFTVTIEKAFNQPDQIPANVTNAQELQQALADPDINSIVLSDDIDLDDLFNGTIFSTRATAGTYGLLIPAGKVFTINLNGKTLRHSKEQTTGYQMILNDGVLVIEDSVGGGKLVYTDTGKGGEYVSNVITNRGTLTVKGGTIENNSSEATANVGFCYAIDSSIWGENQSVTNIEGGTIKSIYSPLRVRADSVDEEVIANISGGNIYGRIDHQMSSSKAGVKGTLNISGGNFYKYGIKEPNIMVFGAGLETDASGIKLNITGGTFDSTILVYRGEYVPLGKGFNEKFIHGGTFAKLEYALPFLADGANISISEPLTVAADEELTLDLTGKSVSYTSEVMNESMIDNKGTLTIKGGKFTYVYAGAPDTSYGKGNYAVNNTNKLTIDGGSIEVVMLQNPKHALYALNDNAINSNTSLTINGGEIINNYGHAFRAITNKQSDITINGGEIIGKTRAIWLQLPGSNKDVAPTINLTINGGTLTGSEFDSSDNKLAIYSYSYGNDMKNVKIDITGGTFNGDIALTGGANKTNIETITVSGGTFNGCYGDVYSYGEADKAKKAISISGGTFSALDVVNYATADADIDIVLGNDVVTTSTATVAAGSKVALDLNGHNVSYAVDNSGATAIIDNKGELNISNSGAEATISFVAANPDLGSIPAYATNTISNTGTLTIGENVVVTNGSDGGASYAVDNHSKFTLNGGKLVGKRCALRVAKYNIPDVVFTMHSGLIEAMTPAWIQLPNSNSAVAPNISVVINDGILRSTKESSADNNAMYTYSYGNSHANTNITINGGQFLGGTVSIGSGYKGDAPTLTIKGGVFEYDVLQWLENDQFNILYKANK